jgi:hypothetical protein
VTIIEIRPFRNGWEVYEAPGVQPVFLTQEQAIDYAQAVRVFAPARFGSSIQLATSSGRSISAKRIENCRAGELHAEWKLIVQMCKFVLA